MSEMFDDPTAVTRSFKWEYLEVTDGKAMDRHVLMQPSRARRLTESYTNDMPRNPFQGKGKKEAKPLPAIIPKEDGKKRKTLKSTDQEARGLLVTSELEKAIAECKAKVDVIVKNCLATNKKFRDIEFDIENDKNLCLFGLKEDSSLKPSDVRRVTQLFKNPQFFVDGAGSNDINQGALGNCWFLSALGALTTMDGLIEKCCVARHEQIGVYGFIFFRDDAWKSVIIDDLLFTSLPRFEELSSEEQALYHGNKEKYEEAQLSGKSLYFARSGTEGETWVPLIEKAYAKLHGDYQSLIGGTPKEAIEDLTGGIAVSWSTKDILDPNKFWKDELLKANKDRIFSVFFAGLDTHRNGYAEVRVNGLVGGHAYSVLRAVECKGKRFVILRNPWGQSEWTGAWGDGSKEWTMEWLQMLPQLGHQFGDDGQFVMEYKDFLECWQQVERTFIFDSSWKMSSFWVRKPTVQSIVPWSFGTTYFEFMLPEASETIIVLSVLDSRYFKDIRGPSHWNCDFEVWRLPNKELVGTSTYATFYPRSVNCELNLQAGHYVVYVRFDRMQVGPNFYMMAGAASGWDERKLSRVLTQRAQSRTVVCNFDLKSHKKYIPLSPADAIERDIAAAERRAGVVPEEDDDEDDDENDDDGEQEEEEQVEQEYVEEDEEEGWQDDDAEEGEGEGEGEGENGAVDGDDDNEPDPDAVLDISTLVEAQDDDLYMGLRIYTQIAEPVNIIACLKY